MGKAGRLACIFVPFALTLASFICLILVEVGGWNKSSSTLNSLYFFQANFTDLKVTDIGDAATSATLTSALQLAKQQGVISNIYQIHLWNYCTSKSANGSIDSCSRRESNFVFDPIDVWQLNSTNITTSGLSDSDANLIQSQIDNIKNNAEQLEDKLLGETGRKALSAYRTVAKWMFIAYQVSFWTTVATLVFSLFAICSRWGSFLTWLLAVFSTFFTFAAVLTSTILFSVLAGALKGVLHPYGVTVTVGTRGMIVGWIAVATSLAATLFWLFSVCCCSGKSNPHHRSNKGGLWTAEPKGQGYHAANEPHNSRGMLRVVKTGSGYERVSSPFLGHSDERQYGDRVPLNEYPAHDAGYEPYRHS